LHNGLLGERLTLLAALFFFTTLSIILMRQVFKPADQKVNPAISPTTIHAMNPLSTLLSDRSRIEQIGFDAWLDEVAGRDHCYSSRSQATSHERQQVRMPGCRQGVLRSAERAQILQFFGIERSLAFELTSQAGSRLRFIA
jgi:hypothetical protein